MTLRLLRAKTEIPQVMATTLPIILVMPHSVYRLLLVTRRGRARSQGVISQSRIALVVIPLLKA